MNDEVEARIRIIENALKRGKIVTIRYKGKKYTFRNLEEFRKVRDKSDITDFEIDIIF